MKNFMTRIILIILLFGVFTIVDHLSSSESGITKSVRAASNTCTSNVECLEDEYCAKAVGDCNGEGSCQPRPEMCPDIWEPVCGCDGNTYGNSCEAAAAGVNVDYEGECAVTCTTNEECEQDEYCAKVVGDCNGEGSCQQRPETCPDIWDPVCGCDGNTYGNSCEAAAAGVNVDHEGECAVTCTTNEECEQDKYCAKAAGDCDGEGTCQGKPEVCPDIWDPVCGCDGNTYGNSCEAAMAGVNVDYAGECTDIPCSSNTDCGENEFCSKEIGDCEGEGSCQPKPEICPMVWDPVCGCDETTYSNDCYAAAAGVSVAYEGECAVTCTSNEECEQDEYCAKADGDCNGEGTCQPRPEVCPDIWDPVCGCDGNTYGNSCEAAAAGVNVDYEGECSIISCASNAECGEDEFCSKEVGDCEGEGSCQPKPEICPMVWDPVCGCDETTYSNDCYAAAAGVNVDYEGVCAVTCTTNEECEQDEYCAKADGDCNGEGTCQPRPEVCPDIWDPVCGCDGNTYGNSCEAAAAGVNVDYEGVCTPTFQRGDVNKDGNINVLDMISVANHILEIIPLDSTGQYLADCNGDNSINVLDLLAIANVILQIYSECPDNGCKPVINSEVMDLLKTLESYLPHDNFYHLMELVKEVQIPREYFLGQNYPNPFNPTTDIRYQIPDSRYPIHTTLNIYNILGQDVKTLVNEVQQPGSYTVTWDGKDNRGVEVPSGIYFYRFSITGGQWSETKRMVLMK